MLPPYEQAMQAYHTELAKIASHSPAENPQYRLWGFILVTVFTLMFAGVLSPAAIVIICAMAFFHVIEF